MQNIKSILTVEEFSELSDSKQREYFSKMLSQMSDEEVKKLYFAIREDSKLQKYIR